MKKLFANAQQNTNAVFSDMAFSARQSEYCNGNNSVIIIEDTANVVSSFVIVSVVRIINIIVRLIDIVIIQNKNGTAYKKLLIKPIA